jgi:hypothetical protein
MFSDLEPRRVSSFTDDGLRKAGSRKTSLARKLGASRNQQAFVFEAHRRTLVRIAQHKRAVGLAIALAAACIMSFIGVFSVFAYREGASPAAVVMYPGLVGFVATAVIIPISRKALGATGVPLPSLPTRSGWLHIALVALFSCAASLCFQLGFFFTEVANVLAFAILAPVQ